MTGKPRGSRPILWGFFVCVIGAFALSGVHSLLQKSVGTDWSKKQQLAESKVHTEITKAFDEKVQDLLRLANEIRRDEVLFAQLRSNSEKGAADAFERLERKRRIPEFTLDIADSRGTTVTWAGKSITNDYASFLPPSPQDSFAVILQTGLHTYLTVGVFTDKKDFIVMASRPLELQYPISNRFATHVSFSEELTSNLRTEAWLALNTTSQIHSHKKTHYVLLKDFAGKTIGYVFYVPATLEGELQALESIFSPWKGFFIACGLGFFGLWCWLRFLPSSRNLIRFFLMSAIIWGLRIGWRALDFPSSLIGGWLFDSSLYASPFPFSLTSSIGELFLTVLSLLLNFIGLWFMMERTVSRPPRLSRTSVLKTLLLGLLVVFMMLFLWSVRGYSEAIRTFVFDSTLKYHDPAVTVPELPIVLMHVNTMLLSMSMIVASFCLVRGFRSIGKRVLPSLKSWWILLAGVFSLCLVIFIWIDWPIQYPVVLPMLVFSAGFIFTLWRDKADIAPETTSTMIWRGFPLLILLSFVVAVPILDAKLHEKERRQVELYADNLLRPADSWISYILSEGLKTVSTGFPQRIYDPVGKSGTALAFSMWAQTLLSREGYNSGLIVYDELGKETGRFTVGMTSFEQREILTKLFENEEEVVQVVDRPAGPGYGKIYGIWSTLRDVNNELIGSVALMVATSQHSFFRGETPEPLQWIQSSTFETTIREVAISEFENAVLTSSGINEWYKGMPLPQRVRDQFRQNRFVWDRENIGPKKYEILYAANQQQSDRVLAVALETLDLRWHIFNFVKIFFVYAGALLLVMLIRAFVNWKRNKGIAIGFREKLVTAFGVLGLLPLFLLGYYNREVATVRVEQNLRRTLSRDLELMGQRIVGSLQDEGDFERGISNDFCEGLASELGVDFAVFRTSQLLASSRPELYQSALLDSRLPGTVFAEVSLLGKPFYTETETVGEVQYAVGYKPLYFNDRLMGVLAVPALYRQKEVDEELVQRNAFVFGVYALAFGFVLAVSFVFANRLSRPLRELTAAAREVGKGNLETHVQPRSRDEIGDLAQTFNAMVDELKRSREELKRVEREVAWREMAKQVAHEIRNPLTPMKLSVQHLRQAFKDKVRNREEILREVTKTIIEQIDVLTRIASEFSSFARMPQRTFERIDVQQSLEEAVALFKDFRGIEFRTIFSDVHMHIVADRDELRRAFVNLIRNSVQAMPKGGVITIEAKEAGRRCVIRVSDTGRGIPPEIRPKIFEPNFSTKTDGMGLGLAIVRKTIEDLGGTISFESEVGKGTTFEIVLPV